MQEVLYMTFALAELSCIGKLGLPALHMLLFITLELHVHFTDPGNGGNVVQRLS